MRRRVARSVARAGSMIGSNPVFCNPLQDSCITRSDAGVMVGLAWYYLLAAMMNAAAAAYVSYGEMVSEGASRLGLAPKTRRLPAWLVGGFFGLYGLAFVVILFRESLPGADGRGLRPVCGGQRASGGHRRCRRRPLRRAESAWPRRGGSLDPAEPGRSPAGRRAGRADQSHSLDADLGHCGGDLPGDGHHLFPGRRDPDAAVRRGMRSTWSPGRPRSSSVRRSASSPCLAAAEFFANGLVGWSIVNLFLLYFGLAHDRLRLPRYRHQARQRADRRPA